MRSNNFYRRDLVVLLLVMLGINSSWPWVENRSTDPNLALLRNSQSGSIELSATAAEDVRKDKPGVFVRVWDAVVNKDQKDAAAAPSQSVKKDNPSFTETKKLDDEKEYIATYYAHPDHGKTIVYLEKKFDTATEAAAGCTGYCNTYALDGVIDPNNGDSVSDFNKRLLALVYKDKQKQAAAVAPVVTSTPIPLANAVEAAAGKGNKAKQKPAAPAPAAEQQEEEAVADDENLDAVEAKCDSDLEERDLRNYVACAVTAMKNLKDSSKKNTATAEELESLYEEHLKENLKNLLESEASIDQRRARTAALALLRVFTSKSQATKKEIAQLLTDNELNSKAREAVSARNRWMAHSKNMSAGDPNWNGQNAILRTEYLKLMQELQDLDYKGRTNNIRNENIWSAFASGYSPSSYDQADNILQDIYKAAGLQETTMYSAITANKSLADMLGSAYGLPEGVAANIVNNAAIAPTPGAAVGNRSARDNMGAAQWNNNPSYNNNGGGYNNGAFNNNGNYGNNNGAYNNGAYNQQQYRPNFGTPQYGYNNGQYNNGQYNNGQQGYNNQYGNNNQYYNGQQGYNNQYGGGNQQYQQYPQYQQGGSNQYNNYSPMYPYANNMGGGGRGRF